MFKFGLFFLLLIALPTFGETPEHPYLVVRTSEYPALQKTSDRWPWWVMKMKALETVRAPAPRGIQSYYSKAMRTYALGSACALTYVIDGAKRTAVLRRVEGELRLLLHDLRTGKEQSNAPYEHGVNVIPAHAAFMMYIVLDIMHGDLDGGARKVMEDDCDFIAGHHANSWFESKYAIEAMKELYHNGPSGEFRRLKDLYRNYLLHNTSDDGVYATGPGYAHSRLFTEERAQKKIFMDVCEYQGFHEFYSEPRFRRMYEWLFGYSVSPFNRTYTFGDSPPTKVFGEYSSAVMRADRFSEDALGYAVWHMGVPTDDKLEGGLLPYLLCDMNAFDKRQPSSRIFKNGGAWLLQREYDRKALAGVLWNVNAADVSHSHYDANSINIEAFGEHILRNSGYEGWNAPDSGTWAWMHRNAESSNTLTIGGQNFSDFRGGGITEGILGYPIEYASGVSGSSLNGGTHARNLIFVQPRDGVAGYFVVIDEVETTSPYGRVDLFFHPNSDNAPTVLYSDRVFQWPIKNCFTRAGVMVQIGLLSIPGAARIDQGYFGSNEESSRFLGNYIRLTYNTGPTGRVALASVIFPYPAETPPPRIENISSPQADGMRMQIGDVVDYLVLPQKGAGYWAHGVETNSRAAYWRGEIYFVRNGTRFIMGGRRGFESDDAVTAVMAEDSGEVVSPGTAIAFRSPGIQSVLLDGSFAPLLARGDGYARLQLPAGNHRVKLIGPIARR